MQEDDPHQSLIAALRSQLTDMATQLTQLNSKLVTSYNRISDLEDTLQETRDDLLSERSKVKELEDRVGVHDRLVNSGSLVSRSEIAGELTKLMERATEEAASRGKAEEAKRNIERDLADLSESLFGEAGRMVSDARKEAEKTERRMHELEKEARNAESVVEVLQRQLRMTIGNPSESDTPTRELPMATRILSFDTTVHSQFKAFLSHVRVLKLSATPQSHPPTLSGLLSTLFVSRLIQEDSDPTLRLDQAPALNWLTRRAVLSAIYSGQLSIEPPMSSYRSSRDVTCVLCGLPSSTSPTVFKLPTTINTSVSTPITLPAALTTFPLCSDGECLRRLRATCTLWSYIRAVIDHVYSTSPAMPPHPVFSTVAPARKDSISSISPSKTSSFAPSRRSLGNLWGAFRNAGANSQKSSHASSPVDAKPNGIEDSFRDIQPAPRISKSFTEPLPSHPNGVPPPLPKRSESRGLVTLVDAVNIPLPPSRPGSSLANPVNEKEVVFSVDDKGEGRISMDSPKSQSRTQQSVNDRRPDHTAAPPPIPRRAARRTVPALPDHENVRAPVEATAGNKEIASLIELNGVKETKAPTEAFRETSTPSSPVNSLFPTDSPPPATPMPLASVVTTTDTIPGKQNSEVDAKEEKSEMEELGHEIEFILLPPRIDSHSPSILPPTPPSSDSTLAKGYVNSPPVPPRSYVGRSAQNKDTNMLASLPSKPLPPPRHPSEELRIQKETARREEEDWEKRTFKHIVKLREEMFLARVGLDVATTGFV